MFQFFFAVALLYSVGAQAQNFISVELHTGAESKILFDSLQLPKSQALDEYQRPIIIKSFSTSDLAFGLTCIEKNRALEYSCRVHFDVDSLSNTDTNVYDTATGAIVAELSFSDSHALSGALPPLKTYETREKTTVTYEGKSFQVPRFSMSCPESNSKPLPCRAVVIPR